jgi:hypothetical protein
MTDFVDRLLGRSAVPTIRPLIPTLFEPVGARQAEDPLPPGVITTAAPQSDDHRREPGPQSPGPAVGPAPGAIGTPGPARPAFDVYQESVLRVETHHHEHTTAAAPVGPAAPAAPRINSVPPAAGQAPLRRTHTAKVPESQPIPTLMTPSPAPAHATGPRTPAPPPIPTRRDRRHEPDVHISIGRVEITAEPATARPPQRSAGSRAPRLSLDDYLRDRGADVR